MTTTINVMSTESTERPIPNAALVCELVADALGLDYDEVTADSSMQTVADWDSLQHLSVVSAIEADFDVIVGPDDIAELNSVTAIVAFLTKSAEG